MPDYSILNSQPGQIDLRVAAAAMSGALNPQSINSSVVPICSTGNCSWPIYHSLAVCSACANLSASVQTNNKYQYLLLNGFILDPSAPSQFDNEYDTNGLTLNVSTTFGSLKTIAFPNHGDVIVDVFEVSSSGPIVAAPIAFECILQFFVKTYNSSVLNGVYIEQELDSLTKSRPTTMASLDDVPVTGNSFLNLTIDGETFSVDATSEYSLSEWFNGTFTGVVMSTRDATYYYSSDIMNSIYQALTGTQDQVYATNSKNYVADLNPIFKNTEKTMKTMLRNGYVPIFQEKPRASGHGPAVGTATRYETFPHVVWPWIILPALVQFLALAFLALVILNTRSAEVEVYKGSLLSVLFHGINENSWRQMSALDEQSALEAEAHDTEMELVSRDGIGWRLLPRYKDKEGADGQA